MLLLKNDFLCTFSNTIHKLLFDVYFSLVSSIPHPPIPFFSSSWGAFPPIPFILRPHFLRFLPSGGVFPPIPSISYPQFLRFLPSGGAFPPIPSIPHPQFLMFSLFSFHPLCYSSIIESNDTGTLTCLMSICCVVVN